MVSQRSHRSGSSLLSYEWNGSLSFERHFDSYIVLWYIVIIAKPKHYELWIFFNFMTRAAPRRVVYKDSTEKIIFLASFTIKYEFFWVHLYVPGALFPRGFLKFPMEVTPSWLSKQTTNNVPALQSIRRHFQLLDGFFKGARRVRSAHRLYCNLTCAGHRDF